MAISLALIILLGLLSDYIFRKLRLPGLIGMLIAGVLMGPYVLNIIDSVLMTVSSDFRMIALVVILLRAGFATKRDTLNRIGKTAIMMGFIPAILEGIVITFAGPFFFDISLRESALLGFIVAAVSPAVIVPMMLRFIEGNKGTGKDIPTLLLASSFLDNVVAIVIFSALAGMYTGKDTSIVMRLLDIPVSIASGITLGIIAGFILYKTLKYQPRATKKTLIVIGFAILLTWLEKTLRPFIAISALSGIIAIGFIILEKSEAIAHKISGKLGKIWIFAEILLFVLVGAQVNIHVALNTGLAGMGLILLGLLARSIGTYLSLFKIDLTRKEKLFCIVSYIPKATVQATIGAVPLSMGIKSGDIMLAVVVLAILITAPLGAIAMNFLGEKILYKE